MHLESHQKRASSDRKGKGGKGKERKIFDIMSRASRLIFELQYFKRLFIPRHLHFALRFTTLDHFAIL